MNGRDCIRVAAALAVLWRPPPRASRCVVCLASAPLRVSRCQTRVPFIFRSDCRDGPGERAEGITRVFLREEDTEFTLHTKQNVISFETLRQLIDVNKSNLPVFTVVEVIWPALFFKNKMSIERHCFGCWSCVMSWRALLPRLLKLVKTPSYMTSLPTLLVSPTKQVKQIISFRLTLK